MNIEQFFLITNPLYWVYFILKAIINAPKFIWKTLLWNKKRFYYQYYDFKKFEKDFMTDTTRQKIDSANSWIERNEKRKTPHRYLARIKSLVTEQGKIINEKTVSEEKR